MSRRDSLLRIAVEQGQSPRVIGALLDAIQAHPELIDLPRAVDRLVRVLRVCRVGSVISPRNYDAEVWREACGWIISLVRQPGVVNQLGGLFWLGEAAPSRNPVMNRGVTRFGFPYAAFLHIPNDIENSQDYERLLAQLLIASQQAGSEHLATQRYGVYQALGRLCELPHCLIQPELNIWGTTEEFVASCRAFSPSRSKSPHAEQIAAISRFVRYCNGELPPVGSGGGGGRIRRTQSAVLELSHYIAEDPRGFVLGDPDDPDQLPGHYNVLTERAEAGDEDLAGDEMSPAVEVWLLDDDACDRPFVADLLSQQGVEAHIVRSRQMIPDSYSQLTVLELRDLLFGASDLFYACRKELSCSQDVSHIQLRMEAIVTLHISLWLGQPTTQTVNLAVVDSADEDCDGLVLVRGDQAYFSMVVRRPELAGDERWQAEAGVRLALLRIMLPDLAGTAGLINTLLAAFPRSSGKVFTYQTDEIEREAKAVLHMLSGGDKRVTPGKVRRYLFHQLVSDTHDVAAASLLSGVQDPSSQTPRYYLQLDASYLRRIYTTSLERVLTQIYACAGLAYQPTQHQRTQRGAVGATHCLLPETIKANVRTMENILRKRPAGRLSAMIAWHNCYTLWVVQMLMLATGCRAIRSPLMHVDQFDPVLSMGALSDKDGDDRHMSRMACIPSVLKRQIEFYDLHCAAVSRQLIGYLPLDGDSDRWSRGFFLWVGETGIRRNEIVPGAIYQQMKQIDGYVPHRVNAYRKFLRTELTERGCPAEFQAAFLGHWLRGEEPQDAFSSFCPVVHRLLVDEWITPLITDLGWLAFASPWGRE